MFVKNHQTALTFQVAHKMCDTELGWNTDEHVDMIRTSIRFMNSNPFSLTQISDNLSDTSFVLAINDLATIFLEKNNMIFTIPFRM